MVPIKEALTFDDVTLAPKYSEILPSEVNTTVQLTRNLKLKIPLLSSAMDTEIAWHKPVWRGGTSWKAATLCFGYVTCGGGAR